MAMNYPLRRCFDVIDALDDYGKLSRLRRIGWWIYRLDDLTGELALLSVLGAVGWWVWQAVHHAGWPFPLPFLFLGAGLSVAACGGNGRQGSINGGIVLGGYGLQLWWSGHFLAGLPGAIAVVTLGVILLLLAAAHHEELPVIRDKGNPYVSPPPPNDPYGGMR